MTNLFPPQRTHNFFSRINLATFYVFFVFSIVLCLSLSVAYAQSPHISYSSPQVYNPFLPKAPLSPTNTGGVIPGTTPVTLGTLAVDITAMALDTSGNIYIAGYNSTSITELKGSTFITLGSTFLHPTGVAVDAAGNIFIADNGNKNIKEIPAGSKTDVIYMGVINNPYGAGALAPYGIAVDAADNLYVSTDDGVFEMPVGNRSSAVFLGGNSDKGVAVDIAGNVYACDINLGEVIQVSNKKTIELAGGLSSLDGIAVDQKGNIYYAQDGANIMELPAGGGAAFPVAKGLSDATSVAVDKKGNIFTESSGSTIQEAPFGIYSITPALPPGLTFDHKTGIIAGTAVAVTAAANYSVSGANASGASTTTINIAVNAAAKPNISYSSPQTFYVGTAGAVSPGNVGGAVPAQQPVPLITSAQANYSLRGLAVDASGNIYTGLLNSDAALGADLIEKLPPGGSKPAYIGSGFSQPAAIAIDGAGNVFVADYGNKVVKEILASNGNTVTIGTGFTAPEGVAVDASGNVYVSDYSKDAIFKIPAGGGTPAQLVTGLNGPTGIAVDGAGNIYIANSKGNNIKEVPAGTTTTITLAAGFGTVYDLAVDSAGNVFVADQGNSVIKRIPAGGGTPVIIAQAVPITHPGAVALDAGSNIYVGDWSNQYIYEINPGYFTNPTLPAGLSINQSTGVISGTPTATQPATNYTVAAYNSGGTSSAVVKIKIVTGSNNSLSGLTINHGTLSPAFKTSTTSYTVSVTNAVASVSFTPTTTNSTAVVTVNGTTVASGAASPSVLLSVGANIFHVLVDSATTETNYAITVNRPASANANLSYISLSAGALTPTFTAATTSYSVSVVNGVASIKVTPTAADRDAAIKVNGTMVASGTASGPIALSVGSTTIIVLVTASDGTSTKTYTLTVTRPASNNANLAGLFISKGTLTPTFSPTTTSYTASEVNSVSAITIVPTSAVNTSTITVNGTTVASGTISGSIPLAVGPNTITTVVTAQDGTTTKTYTITVTRAAGPVNNFDAAISVSKPEETPTLADDGIAVHQAVSPNGDGINDFLVIENISQYPDNKLTIMNRSGQLIYEASGYDNASKVFDGHSNKNGQMQLPGTYFYQLDYTVSGIVKHKTGFIVLKY